MPLRDPGFTEDEDMLFKPLLGTDLSGKVGGIVASHNAGGAYFRAATIPTNPNSPQQQVVRAAVTQLTNQWTSVLTPIQRAEWDLYAFNVKVTNRIGEQVNISGLAMFVRCNVVRVQGNQAAVLDGPGEFNLSFHTPPTLDTWSEATQSGNLNFFTGLLTDLWANEVGGFLFVFISRPQNASINFFRGPYRQSGGVTGDPVPPVPPAVITSPFPFIAGQKIFGRVVTVTADGRASPPTFMETIAVA